MFIVDAFIVNWGFLYDTRTDAMTLAPVYDCVSSLYPQEDETIMESVLARPSKLNFRIYEIQTSAIMVNEKKLKYFDFISSLQNDGCNQALKRIIPRIDRAHIRKIVEDIPFISDLQRRFYLTMLAERKRLILDFSLAALERKESGLGI